MRSQELLRRYIDIIKETTHKKAAKDWDKDGEIESPEDEYKGVKDRAIKKAMAKEEYSIDEKWGKPTTVSPEERGKYKGKSKADLLKMYNTLKKSGPHKKGSPEYGRMRELAFAIRAKTGWGKVK